MDDLRKLLISPSDDPLAEGRARRLLGAAKTGTLHRLRYAKYVEAETWVTLDSGEKHRLKMHAVNASAKHCAPICSGESAAILWGLPVAALPEHVQINISPGSGQRSAGLARRRIFPTIEPGPWEIDGLAVTGKIQTAVELALRQQFPSALAAMDRLLNIEPLAAEQFSHPVLAPQVIEAILKLPSKTKMRRALAVVDLAVAESGSVGESISRANMHLAGLPTPTLQKRFDDTDGLIGYTDFDWQEFGVAGELDGRVKYRNPEYLRGRDPSEVVIAEKEREDRLRALGLTVVRWTWETANDPRRLATKLRAAGVKTQLR